MTSSVGWDLPIGSQFVGYKITGLLGRGGMSVVYAAEHVTLGRQVALKLLDPALAANEEFRERFIRESRLAASLDHPNIISIYDAGEANGILFIAMRHVDGADLRTVIDREGPLSLGQTLFFIEQVASALADAHERGLVHRDVKPANILVVGSSDRVYLTDFGVVKQTSSRGLTKTGYFLGTFEYAAPEQIEGKAVDGRTDIYALGCVLYECLSGFPPFDAETEGSVIHAHLVEPPPKLSARRPDLPSGLNEVIATAMAKSKEDRYPSAADFVRALRQSTVDLGLRPAATVPSAQGTVLSAAPPAEPSQEPLSAPPPAIAPAPSAASVGPREPRTLVLTRRSLAGLIALVAALIAGAVVATAVLRDGSSSANPPTPPTTTPPVTTTPTTTAKAPSSIAIGLAGVVPAFLDKNCKTVASTSGAAQTALCTPPSAMKGVYYPDSWQLSLYPSTPAVLKAYEALRRGAGIGRNFGRCNSTQWGGEGAWLHGDRHPGGRQFCYFDGNVAVIVWTHEKLGQASHLDTLGIARAGGSDHFDLFSWYRFWHHRIGKCLQPGCVARLT